MYLIKLSSYKRTKVGHKDEKNTARTVDKESIKAQRLALTISKVTLFDKQMRQVGTASNVFGGRLQSKS